MRTLEGQRIRPARGILVLTIVLVTMLGLLFMGGVAGLVVIAALLAYIFDPAVTSLEFRGLSRTAATVVFVLSLTAVLCLLSYFLVPVLFAQIDLMRSEVTTEQTDLIVTRLQSLIRQNLGFVGLEELDLHASIQEFKIQLSERVMKFLVEDSLALIIRLVTIPFMMFFFLKDGREMKKQLIRLVPNRYFEFSLDLLHKMDLQLGNYLRSQFLDALIFGAMSTVALWLMGVKYFLFIGIFAGLANLIPYVGPIAGVIPAVVVSVLETGDITKAIYVILVYVALKLVDDFAVQPMVVARGVDVHPVLVLLAIMIGGHLFGIVGMLVAVPFAGFLKVVLQESVVTFRKYRFS
jgi:predicted PurR-regulated permease PerM